MHQSRPLHAGLRAGRKGECRHHLLAACASRSGGAAHALPGTEDHHQRTRHRGRRHLLRRERGGALPASGGSDPGRERHRHASVAAEFGLGPLSRRLSQFLRPGRQEPGYRGLGSHIIWKLCGSLETARTAPGGRLDIEALAHSVTCYLESDAGAAPGRVGRRRSTADRGARPSAKARAPAVCVSAPSRDPTINRLKSFNYFADSPRGGGPDRCRLGPHQCGDCNKSIKGIAQNPAGSRFDADSQPGHAECLPGGRIAPLGFAGKCARCRR
jgi:hypothetical protein